MGSGEQGKQQVGPSGRRAEGLIWKEGSVSGDGHTGAQAHRHTDTQLHARDAARDEAAGL